MSSEVPGELRSSVDSLGDPEELVRRLRRDGYVFLRGLLPREGVLDLRRAILEVCQRHGWLSPGSSLLDGEKLLDETVFVHPMKIARISFPNNVKQTTPAHQDDVHIQGSFETYTSWIPLGDMPFSLGGLAVDVDGLGLDWHGTEHRAGDVLVFPSTATHKALPNLSGDRLRLSVDYRYTGLTHAVGEGSLKPHYHWQVPDLPVHVVPLTDARARVARSEENR